MQKPYINLGCGTIILPCAKPAHHALLPDAIYEYPLWENVDRNAGEGVDRVVDLFRYPWPLESNAYDGALLSHICEHIPHEIRLIGSPESGGLTGRDIDFAEWQIDNDDPEQIDEKFAPAIQYVKTIRRLDERREQLANLQDGWFAFFAELYRILTPGAQAHILSPYAWTHAAWSDPTHTRALTDSTFAHSMKPDPGAAFHYATGGIHFEVVRMPVFNIMPQYAHLADNPAEFTKALATYMNVVYDFTLSLEAVK